MHVSFLLFQWQFYVSTEQNCIYLAVVPDLGCVSYSLLFDK